MSDKASFSYNIAPKNNGDVIEGWNVAETEGCTSDGHFFFERYNVADDFFEGWKDANKYLKE